MDKVILAFEGEKTCERVRDVIESAGVASCLVCHSAAEVKRLVYKRRVTTIVCGYKLRDETAEALFDDLPANCSMLVIATQGLLDLMESDEIFKLPAPVPRNDLLSSVNTLLLEERRMERFVRPQRSQEELELVERAKEVLMERHDMTEEQAHRFLQKRSMDSGSKLIQTARMVLVSQGEEP